MIRFGQKTLATFLILSSFFAGAERAHAIVAVTPGSYILQAFDTIVNTIGNGLDAVTSYASMSLAQKEIIWDGVASGLFEAARKALVQSIIDWIRTGFQGSPAFVQNLKGYFEGIGDEIAAEFITGVGLDALCSPFALDIRAALILQFEKDRKNGGVNKYSFKDLS